MTYNDVLRAHITNIMDCYCTYYDVRCEKEANSKLIPSIFDDAHQKEFHKMLGKIAECVCTYMRVDYSSLTFEDYASVKAHLNVKNQYKLMHEKLNEEQLLRYLEIFYRSCYEFNRTEEMSKENIEEFRHIYLDVRLDEYFNKYVEKKVRMTQLQDKMLEGALPIYESEELSALERSLLNSYKDLDLVFLKSNANYDKIISKEEPTTDRSYFKYLYNKQLMRLLNPMQDSTSWQILLDRYVTAGLDVNLERADKMQNLIGLFNARLTLLGQNDIDNLDNRPITIDALEKDNADTVNMFDGYFASYNKGYKKYDDYLKKIKRI